MEKKPPAADKQAGTLAEIVICMGSSCFSRGNKKSLPLIQEYLATRKLHDVVHFKGSHCCGQCDQGPILKVDGHCHTQVTESGVTALLDAFFENESGKNQS